MFTLSNIRGIYYKRPNQNYKNLCFREHVAWTPLSHFVHTIFDLFGPMARLFQSEQNMQSSLFSQVNLQYIDH